MGARKPEIGLEPADIALIRMKAKQLSRLGAFADTEKRDLVQDMILDLLRRLPKFDPTKSQRATFVSRVVCHKASSMIKYAMAQCRDYRREYASLNNRTRLDEAGHWLFLAELISIEDCLDQDRGLQLGTREQADLSLDLERAVAALPYRLARICRGLMQSSRSSVAHHYHLAPDIFLRRIARIRRLLAEQGIGDYLANPDLADEEIPIPPPRRRRRRKNANSK